MKKKAILSINFGTNDPASAAATIDVLEQEYLSDHPSCTLYSAITNLAVIDQMKEGGNYDVYAVRETMARMVLDGVTHLYAQPSYLMNGVEYTALVEMVESHKADFISVECGTPLLTTHEDMQTVCRALIEEFGGLTDEEGVVLIGHGSPHHTNMVYCALDYVFKDLGAEHFYTGTFNAFPQIDTVAAHVKKAGIKKVHLMPFMFAAGTSAMEGVCGDAQDSMKSRLTSAGLTVTAHRKCLGELSEVRSVFRDHLRATME